MPDGKDLATDKFPELEWGAAEAASSLDKIYTHVVAKARGSERWYFAKKGQKKLLGWILRVTAIVAAPLAGVIPVLSGIMGDNAWFPLEPEWATVLIALAGLCIMLDRFGGYTSGWVRYVLTAQKIGQALEKFEFEWEARQAEYAANQLSPEQIHEFLTEAQHFAANIGALVAEETSQWATEFEGALKQIEAAAKSIPAPAKHGAIDVTVKNGSQSKGGWQLEIDNRASERKTGNRAAVNDLAPGLVVIRIQGEIADKPAVDEQAIEVVAGKVVKVEMELVSTE